MDTDTATDRAGDPLDGLRILVTRPAGQAERLCRMIESAGGEALRCPAMEIQDVEADASLSALIDRLDDYDMAIFISANAVDRGLAQVRSRRAWPRNIKLAAVGRHTAAALRRQGLRADIYPPRESNSETLLATDAMREVSGRRVVIFRGRGGRELLRDTLIARGAAVDYAEVYRRARPTGSLERLLRQAPSLITVTSRAALENLIQMAGAAAHRLRDIPLILGSPHLLDPARALGFKRPPAVAEEPGDDALFAAILDWTAHRVRLASKSHSGKENA